MKRKYDAPDERARLCVLNARDYFNAKEHTLPYMELGAEDKDSLQTMRELLFVFRAAQHSQLSRFFFSLSKECIYF